MTNAQIIMLEMATRNIDEELHTFNHWKALGYRVKKGEHGIETRLWKYNAKNKTEEAPEGSDEDTKAKYKSGFYLAKSYLFKRSQVEEVENVDTQ